MRMVKKIKKLKVIELVATVSGLMAIAIIGTKAHFASSVRTKNHFALSAISKTKDFLEASEGLPIDLPDSIEIGDSFLQGSTLVLADPYDTKRDNRARLTFRVDYVRNTNALYDFSFKGHKLKYIRFTDNSGIVYSYGPDRDDDLNSLVQNTTGDLLTTQSTSRVLYDPTNGSISNGDIFLFVTIKDDMK